MSIKIEEHIVLHLVTNEDQPNTQLGWIHTHGMEKFDLPDLEIRGIPLFFGEPAMALINQVAQYMVDLKEEGREVKLGERMQIGPMAIFKFVELEPIPGDEAHFEHTRWALSDEPMRSLCAGQEAAEEMARQAAERPV